MPVTLLQQRNRTVFNPKDYGATFNGTTDDTAAIQATINAMSTSSPSTLWVPEGIGKLTASLTVPAAMTSGFSVMGTGWGSILKLANGVNDYAIKFLAGSSGLIGATFRDFKIDCNATGQTTGGGGIDANGAYACLFDHLWIHAPFNDAIHIHGGPGSGNFGYQSFVTNCLFLAGNTSSGNGRGLSLDSTDQIMIIGNDFREMGGTSGSDAFAIRDQNGLHTIMGNIFTNNLSSNIGGGAIKTYSNFSRIIGNMFESLTQDNVALEGNKHIVQGNVFANIGKGASSANSANGISTNANNSIITGNYFNTDGTASNGTKSLIFMDNSTTGNIVTGNQFDLSNGGSGITTILLGTGTTNKISRNVGWTTETSGTASITTGNTTVVVTHGLSATPTLQQIGVTPQTSLGSATFYWISNPTSTNFTINTNANPAGTVIFGWRADLGY